MLTTPSNPLADTFWTATVVSGQVVSGTLTTNFDSSGGVNGYGGCNSYSGSYTVSGDSLSISGYHAFSSKWAVMADYTWTQWSRIQTLDIKLDDGSQSVAKWNYEDSSRFSIGTEYTHNNKWKYRAGLMHPLDRKCR